MDEYKRRRRRSRAAMFMFLDSIGGSIDDVDVAEFDSDGSDLKALIVGIEFVQSGTGDPSPDNVRPITGHSSVNVIVSPTLNPLDGTITNIPLGTTVYGGQLDVLTGVLTVTHAITNLEEGMTIATIGSAQVWTKILSDAKTVPNGNIANITAEAYKAIRFNAISAYVNHVALRDIQILCVNTGSADIMPVGKLVYELATPQIIQLTGQQIATFLGTNHVWCDSGKIIHLEY